MYKMEIPDNLLESGRYLDRPQDHLDFGEEKWGVFFINTGGPEEIEDTHQYLYSLYSDAYLTSGSLPAIFRKQLARLQATRRAASLIHHYQAIGGGSPLLRWTRLTASGVKRELSKQFPQAEVFAGMRYAEPYIHEEIEAAVDEGCRHLILFPMSPQGDAATTQGSLTQVADWLEDDNGKLTVSLIDSWHTRPEFINLLRTQIELAKEKMAAKNPRIVFVARAFPDTTRELSKSYLEQVTETAVMAGAGYEWTLAYNQLPGLKLTMAAGIEKTIIRLAADGITDMIIVPISLTTDSLETLFDIDITLRETAAAVGIQNFLRIDSLNDDPVFAQFLADLVEEKIGAKDLPA